MGRAVRFSTQTLSINMTLGPKQLQSSARDRSNLISGYRFKNRLYQFTPIKVSIIIRYYIKLNYLPTDLKSPFCSSSCRAKHSRLQIPIGQPRRCICCIIRHIAPSSSGVKRCIYCFEALFDCIPANRFRKLVQGTLNALAALRLLGLPNWNASIASCIYYSRVRVSIFLRFVGTISGSLSGVVVLVV